MLRRVDERQPPLQTVLVRVEQGEPGLRWADALVQRRFDRGERTAGLGRAGVTRRAPGQVLREARAAQETQGERTDDKTTDQGHGMLERAERFMEAVNRAQDYTKAFGTQR